MQINLNAPALQDKLWPLTEDALHALFIIVNNAQIVLKKPVFNAGLVSLSINKLMNADAHHLKEKTIMVFVNHAKFLIVLNAINHLILVQYAKLLLSRIVKELHVYVPWVKLQTAKADVRNARFHIVRAAQHLMNFCVMNVYLLSSSVKMEQSVFGLTKTWMDVRWVMD